MNGKDLLFLVALIFGCLTMNNLSAQKSYYLEYCLPNKKLRKIKNPYNRLVAQFIGHFSNEAHLKANPEIQEPLQEIIMTPILRTKTDCWVYIEFFSPLMVENPILQRVDRVMKKGGDTIVIQPYTLKNGRESINRWKSKTLLDAINIEKDLIIQEGCSVVMVPDENKKFVYKSIDQQEVSCHLPLGHGVEYMGLKTTISDKGHQTKLSFYNKDKELLRESSGDGVEFWRVDISSKNYKDRGATK